MKKRLILLLITFMFLGCVQKTIVLSSNRPVPVVYEEPVVYYERVPQYEGNTIPATSQTYSIDPIKAYDMIQGDPFVMLLDVRTKQEQKTDGKIANSLLIPLDVLKNNLHKLDKSKTMLVYGHVGNRSLEAIKLLSRNGFDAVEIKGGIAKWKEAHLPVRYER